MYLKTVLLAALASSCYLVLSCPRHLPLHKPLLAESTDRGKGKSG